MIDQPVKYSEGRLKKLGRAFKGKRIAIVGDMMIDRYYWGSVGRVSPEAPVPVVDVSSESTRLGGAANVANNVQTLGGEPLLIGLVGNDHEGESLKALLKEQGMADSGIVVDRGRRTTTKTRVIAHGQHVVRVDQESKENCSEEIEQKIIDALRKNLKKIDALILEDYNKGVVTKSVIHETIELARKNDTIIAVDPKFENFFEYKNVTVFKPNLREIEEALGGRLRTVHDLVRAGNRMIRELSAANVLVTRGEEGMSLFESGGAVTHIQTMADNVQDVSGAGDTVIATLTMALAAGATVREAAVLANYAGGIVVGSVGIVPIQLSELLEVALHPSNNRGKKT
jgi:rfaE bifunctional protein kinase chain/domain